MIAAESILRSISSRPLMPPSSIISEPSSVLYDTVGLLGLSLLSGESSSISSSSPLLYENDLGVRSKCSVSIPPPAGSCSSSKSPNSSAMSSSFSTSAGVIDDSGLSHLCHSGVRFYPVQSPFLSCMPRYGSCELKTPLATADILDIQLCTHSVRNRSG